MSLEEDLEKNVTEYQALHEKRSRAIAVLKSLEQEITGKSAVIEYLSGKLKEEPNEK